MKKLKKTLAVLMVCTAMASSMVSVGALAATTGSVTNGSATVSDLIDVSVNSGVEFNRENWYIEDKYADCNYYNGLSRCDVSMAVNYNDSFFDINASEEAPELAKLGSLLSAADDNSISGVYSSLGFTRYSVNYNKELTDDVAFSLGVKRTKDKRIFMLTVRDTGDRGEWYSNFNVGDGDTHEGYAVASKNVLESIQDYIDAYASTDSSVRNVILVTGHGRGAAVSNLVAAELSASSDYFTADDVFGYTYNCPAVSKKADQSLTNIRNYNTYANMPSLLPLEQWGYERNGIDVKVDINADVYKNFLYQYSRRTNGYKYVDSDASEVLGYIAENTGDAYGQYSEEDIQFAYGLFADCMTSDNNIYAFEEKIGNRLAKYRNSEYIRPVCESFINLISESDGNNSVDVIMESAVIGYDEKIKELTDVYDNCKASVSEWDAYVSECEANETDPYFYEFYDRNIDYYSILLSETQGECYSIEDLRDNLNKLDSIIESYGFFKSKFDAYCFLLSSLVQDTTYTINGNDIFDIAYKAAYSRNTADVSYLFVNSMYYGNDGWREYPIKKITVPDNVKRIGAYCFYDCTALNEIVIPDSVEMIDSYALGGCFGIKNLTVPVDICSRAYFDAENLMNVNFTYGRTGIMPDFDDQYPASWYNEYESIVRGGSIRSTLATVSFDDDITYIGENTFCNYSGLYNIKFPASLKTIGKSAFENCMNLTDVTLPDGVYNLKENAFSNCNMLETIYLPDSIGELGENCFYGDGQLTIDKIPSNIKKIGEWCFAHTNGFKDNTLVIPDTVEEIGENALYNTNVENLTLCCDLKLNEVYYDFYTDLKELTITSGKTTIVDYYNNYYGNTPFVNADNLEKVNIGEGITELAENTFVGCYMREVSLPDTLTKISDRAFSGCANLEKINIPESVTYIGNDSLSYGDFEEITLPSGLKYLGSGAFYNCNNLNRITVPSGIKEIGSSTFENCYNLSEANVPFDITSVGKSAFAETQISRAFIPEGQETIERSTFLDCTSLGMVIIPKDVKVIDSYAFYECYNLKDVYYGGSESDWQNVVKSIDGNDYLNGATIHYNSDTSFTIDNVENLKTSAITSSSVKLSWDNVKNAKNYVVEQYKNGVWTKIATVTGNSFNVTGLAEGTAYKFRVNANKISLYDTEVNGEFTEVSAITGINAPSDFKALGTNNSAIRLGWNANNNVDGYIIEKLNGSTWERVTKITANSTSEYRATNLAEGNEYKFRIQTYKVVNGTTIKSAYTELTANTKVLPVKNLEVSSVNTSSAVIEWDKNVNADGYIVQIYKDGAWTQVAKTTALEYEASELAEGTEYKFRVQAYKGSIKSDVVTVSATTMLNAVTNVKVLGTNDGAIRFGWDKNVNAEGYIVEQYKNGTWVQIAKTTAIEYKVTGLAEGTAYNFRVQAYKGNAKSDYSILTANTKLKAVTNLSALGTNEGAIRFGWDKNANAEGYIVEQYKNGAWVQIAKTTALEYKVTGLAEGTAYKFRVQSYKGNAKSDYSTLTASTKLKAVANTKTLGTIVNAVNFCWDKNVNAEGYIVEQYKNGTWVQIAKTTALEYKVTGLAEGTEYKFRVQAYNGTSKSDYTTLTAITGINAPSDFKALGTNDAAIRLGWTANNNVDGYIIEKLNGSTWERVTKITANTTSEYRVVNLAEGNGYKFRIQAYKVVNGTTVKSAYTNLTANTKLNAVTNIRTLGTNDGAIRFGWDKNVNAEGYIVEQYKNGAWVQIAKTTALEYKVTGLAEGTAYNFRVKAFKGNVTSIYTTFTANTKLKTVTNVSALGTNEGAIRFGWDKNANAEGYIVEQYKNGAWVQIAKTTALEYKVTGLAEGTVYKFRVQAYKGNAKSDYSTLTASTKLKAVTNVQVLGTNTSAVRFGWDKNANAEGYIVEQYKNGAWVQIAKTTALEYRVAGLNTNCQYNFRVRAFKMSNGLEVTSVYTNLTAKTK